MKRLLIFSLWSLVLSFIVISPAFAATYYVAPDANLDGSPYDKSASTEDGSLQNPFKTFNRAWQDTNDGDILFLIDGIYYQTLWPKYHNGSPGNPITIKALNDGKAIIDGEFIRVPIRVGDCWAGGCPIAANESSPVGNYYVLEGIVARNGDTIPDPVTGLTDDNGRTINIAGHDNVLRNVSAYNADTDGNSAVIGVGGSYNLIEDCIAAGTGRKMLFVSPGSSGSNTFRRCFVFGTEYLERNWHDNWPWMDGIQVYNASHNTFENVISFGSIPSWGISVQANSPGAVTTDNQVLGSIVMNMGMNRDGTVKWYGCPWDNPTQPEPCGAGDRPQPSQYTTVTDFDWPLQRVGFALYGPGLLQDNLFQDNFSYNNAGWGLGSGSTSNSSNSTNVVNRMTVVNNGLDLPCGAPYPCGYGGLNTDASTLSLYGFTNINDSIIANLNYCYKVPWPNNPGQYLTQCDKSANMNMDSCTWVTDPTDPLSIILQCQGNAPGQGSNLNYRYENRQMTSQPLWPWSMEDRVKSEFADPDMIGANYTIQNFSVTNAIYPILAQYGAVSGGSSNKPGDVDGDGDVDITDLASLLSTFGGSNPAADFNGSGTVDISDLATLLSNFGS